ncbi:energy-coupling factor ABC transporter ATP-binding protein [Sporosarcina sp. NPDC096371]|uniref:energy-coupling factor ABC transporter ATP-binding protein n=1 Tax=Sporosarcina sp. NPDC096371 TaxID=3364530 RepID=UPI00381D4D71
MSIITMKNVYYQYPLEKEQVLKNINLSIEKGKVYGLVGHNDAGKTTLCNVIRGFIPNFYRGKLTGDIELNGKSIQQYSMGDLATKIGYSFQNPFTQISGVKETVFEEIAYGLENLGTAPEVISEKVSELITLFKLEAIQEKNPFELSGGQKQRVALAAIIALDPEILVIDEPTSQLDPQGTEEIFEIIDLMKKKGKTIILVEHKIDLIAAYVDEVIVMSHGEIKMVGKTAEVFTNEEVITHGGQLPQVALLSLALEKEGITLPTIPITLEEAKHVIEKILPKGVQ